MRDEKEGPSGVLVKRMLTGEEPGRKNRVFQQPTKGKMTVLGFECY